MMKTFRKSLTLAAIALLTTQHINAQGCEENLGIIAYPGYCSQVPVPLSTLQNNPNYALPAGGVWTNPQGVVESDGIFNPGSDLTGIYSYQYINSEGCTVTAQIQIFGEGEFSSGTSTTITVCTTDPPFVLLEMLEGNPTPGGQWLHNYVGAPNPGFANFYASHLSLVEIDPSALSQNSTFTYATGTPPCTPQFVDLTVNVIQGGSGGTTSITSCLPYEWNGELYTEPGTYVQGTNTGFDCEATQTLQLTAIDGGTLTANGTPSVCSGAINSSTLDVSLTGAAGPNSLYYITPLTATNIVAMSFSSAQFNWNLIPAGSYRLWHVKYADGATIVNVSNAAQFDGCHAISNAIVFEVEAYSGGLIGTASNTNICLNQGAVSINASVTAASGPYGKWILTDTSLNILAQGSTSSEFNLNVLDPGDYRIYHVRYTTVNALLGLGNLNLAPECVFLSNPISFSASNCFGGIVMESASAGDYLNSNPNPTWGISVVDFTLSETKAVTLDVYDGSGRLVRSLYNAVAEKDLEYRFEFDGSGLPPGLYIYRLTTPNKITVNKFLVM